MSEEDTGEGTRKIVLAKWEMENIKRRNGRREEARWRKGEYVERIYF